MRDWDAFNNNEPFWTKLHDVDLDQYMIDAGFERSELFHGGVTAVVDRSLFPDGGGRQTPRTMAARPPGTSPASMSEPFDAIALAGAKAKGKRPYFFADADVERVLSIAMAVAGELAVTRMRLDTLEQLLIERGIVAEADIENFAPNAAQRNAAAVGNRNTWRASCAIVQQEREAIARRTNRLPKPPGTGSTMPESRSAAARTLFDKLWDSHCIETDSEGEGLLYIDRVCLHERTGSIALAELAACGQFVRRPHHVFCMMDHIVDTRPGRRDATPVPGGEDFIVGLRRYAAQFGLRLFDVDDADQGIGHLVSAEQGHRAAWARNRLPRFPHLHAGCAGLPRIRHRQQRDRARPRHIDVANRQTRDAGGCGRRCLGTHATAKDLALALIAEYGAAGGLGAALEFRGAAVANLDIEARMTLCNMAVEFGAATALVALDQKTIAYIADRPYAPATPAGCGLAGPANR